MSETVTTEKVVLVINPDVRKIAVDYVKGRNMAPSTIKKYEAGKADEETLLQSLQAAYELSLPKGDVTESVSMDVYTAVIEAHEKTVDDLTSQITAAQKKATEAEEAIEAIEASNARQTSVISKLAAEKTHLISALESIKDRLTKSFFGRKASIEAYIADAYTKVEVPSKDNLF